MKENVVEGAFNSHANDKKCIKFQCVNEGEEQNKRKQGKASRKENKNKHF